VRETSAGGWRRHASLHEGFLRDLPIAPDLGDDMRLDHALAEVEADFLEVVRQLGRKSSSAHNPDPG